MRSKISVLHDFDFVFCLRIYIHGKNPTGRGKRRRDLMVLYLDMKMRNGAAGGEQGYGGR